MEKGADIDIVSRRPKAQITDGLEEEREKREEMDLRDKANMIGLVQSEGGKMFLDIVTGRLEKRINKLISEDPEARALLDVLKAAGIKYRTAKEAMNHLYERFIGEED